VLRPQQIPAKDEEIPRRSLQLRAQPVLLPELHFRNQLQLKATAMRNLDTKSFSSTDEAESEQLSLSLCIYIFVVAACFG
jgi:hypothetical protein